MLSCAKRRERPHLGIKPILTAYAESTDSGRTFQKPLLHFARLGNSTANNIIDHRPRIGAVFIDATEPPGSSRRYRAVSGNTMHTSADGLTWAVEGVLAVPSAPLFSKAWGLGAFDTEGVAFWDPPCSCFSFYTRCDGGYGTSSYFRMVRRARAANLSKMGSGHDGPLLGEWINQSVVMRADALDNATHPSGDPEHKPALDYYGSTPWRDTASGMYFMAAVRYWHWSASAPWHRPGTYDIGLAASRDGADFRFVEREAWLRPGLDGSVGTPSWRWNCSWDSKYFTFLNPV